MDQETNLPPIGSHVWHWADALKPHMAMTVIAHNEDGTITTRYEHPDNQDRDRTWINLPKHLHTAETHPDAKPHIGDSIKHGTEEKSKFAECDAAADFVTSGDTRTVECRDCGKAFTYEPFIISGKELLAQTVCDSCSDTRANDHAEKARKRAAEAEWERVVPKSYRRTDKKHEGFNTRLWDTVNQWYLQQIESDKMEFLGLVGETGRCKTRCLALLAKRFIWEGLRVEWCLATGFQWACQRQWSDDEGYKARMWLKKWRNADVLILDDLGKQKWTDNVEAEFYDLFEHRTKEELLTLWSANTHPEDMIKAKQLTKDRGAPIVGRLLDNSEIVLV